MLSAKSVYEESESILDEIFEELENLKPKQCNFGYYREKVAHKFLEPKERKLFFNSKWNLKRARPLKVVYTLPGRVLFILTSTKSGEFFGCPHDFKYGFFDKVPQIDFSKCETLLADCKWIKLQKSTVFRKPHKGFCLIWSLSLKVFEEVATICGKCGKGTIHDRNLNRWIRDEVEKFKNMIKRKRTRR